MSNVSLSPAPPHVRDGFRWQGQRIGLLGGSFNPPHEGHVHIARLAMLKFKLDFVWWIVTPQNPLKDKAGIAPYNQRFEQVQKITERHPRLIPTHIENDLGTQYTSQTITHLRSAFPKTDFLWICGTDNAMIFHKWEQWTQIINDIPIVFIARPPASGLVKSCPLRLYKQNRIHHFRANGSKTDLSKPGIYWLNGTKMIDISSTKIRNKSNR